jgi:hypothetical protein
MLGQPLGLLGCCAVELLCRLAEQLLGLVDGLADDLSGLLPCRACDVGSRAGGGARHLAGLLPRGTRDVWGTHSASARLGLCCWKFPESALPNNRRSTLSSRRVGLTR